jgi:hypothetical protein
MKNRIIMMRTKLILLFILPWFSISAQNADLSGTWKVEGENPDEKKYDGTLELNKKSKVHYVLKWDIDYAGQEQKLNYPGTAVFDDETRKMYAAYGVETYRYGLIVYELNEYGGLSGRASWTSHKGMGTELIAGQLGKRKIAGTYEIVGKRSKGAVELGVSETYRGTLKVVEKENRFDLQWFLGDGQPYAGFAYRVGNQLIGVWGTGDSYGMEMYQFDKELQSATSEWVSPAYDYRKGLEYIEKMTANE